MRATIDATGPSCGAVLDVFADRLGVVVIVQQHQGGLILRLTAEKAAEVATALETGSKHAEQLQRTKAA